MLAEALLYPTQEYLTRAEKQPLSEHIEYFDINWYKEGLPKDWYNIDDVGFSLKTQMGILTDPNYPPYLRAEQTGRDLLGFALEYLRQGIVFPFEYHVRGQDLIDIKYGGKRLMDTVKVEERGGAVKESLARIQNHLLRSDGSSAIMVSPQGATGLTTDDGREITYKDTQIYHFQRVGDKVIGTTIRTDFDLKEAKDLINALTGQTLPDSATPPDYVRSVTLSGKDTILDKVENLIQILKTIRPMFAYREKTWTDAENLIPQRQKLYDFNEATRKIIEDFKTYYTSRPLLYIDKTKALAATFLRISKYFVGKNIGKEYGISPEAILLMTHGQVLEEVRRLPGCAGDGSSVTSVKSITERSAFSSSVSDFAEKDEHGSLYFPCPHLDCGKMNKRPRGKLITNCQHCGKDVRC